MFDRTVIVDWSANSRPTTGRDSIWIAVHDAHGVRCTNHATRSLASTHLARLVDLPGRTLVGVDFSLGFPRGTGDLLHADGDAWRAMWELLARAIVDDERNRNNRFAVAADLNRAMSAGASPFWGCPPSSRSSTLSSTKPPSMPVGEWRVVEEELRSQGRRPFSSWQLLGAGSVGSQSLLGIPVLYRLVDERSADVDVWPFTCGLSVPERRIVIAEVWPSLVTIPSDDGRVRDHAQVDTLARRLHSDDVVELFASAVDPVHRATVVEEEGWILGA